MSEDEELRALGERANELRRQMGVSTASGTTPAPWLTDVVPDILAEMRIKQAEAEAHAAACTDRPCERCERFVCRCGAPVDGRPACPACSERDAMAYRLQPTRDSVPVRFEWTEKASPREVAARVGMLEKHIAEALAAPPSKNMLLMGPTRAGKTSLAIAMMFAWVRASGHRRRGAIYVTAPDLARSRMRHRLGDGEAPLVERALYAPLLLLDDLGREGNDRDNCITDVVYGRHDQNLPTWITSGIDLPPGTDDDQLRGFAMALAERYDGGFVRRILETGKPIRLGAR